MLSSINFKVFNLGQIGRSNGATGLLLVRRRQGVW